MLAMRDKMLFLLPKKTNFRRCFCYSGRLLYCFPKMLAMLFLPTTTKERNIPLTLIK